jgi:hypothetical protein
LGAALWLVLSIFAAPARAASFNCAKALSPASSSLRSGRDPINGPLILIARDRGALYLTPLVHPWRHEMRADVEAAAADIEQSIGLLRRRL